MSECCVAMGIKAAQKDFRSELQICEAPFSYVWCLVLDGKAGSLAVLYVIEFAYSFTTLSLTPSSPAEW